ncbi:uncharacterized protein LOC125227783 [Leguminivora glycinivorella]|uniref:uncharacterized protein LOC125227783 n=1 Tax=Leguminivora glycinivorella TaxID=1035111 RepID=UPI00200E9F63|nr:uncharacterized protein LOC125227783 [Leguminivora glycinivorella]
MTVPPTMKKINKKIPGILPPPPKTEIDGKISDLSSKTVAELRELRDRQVKLLNNKSFISKLADKGVKIQALHDRIVKELKAKEDEEQTCRLLDNLTLSSVNKQTMQDLEWLGKSNKSDTYLDSDDDSEPEDVLQILSQSTAHEKTVKVLPPEKPLVTPEDVAKIEELPHIKYLVEKTESNTKPKATGNFKPYKTTKSDVHNPEKELLRKKHKHWEVTAATPPPSIHGPAKVLSLEESLNLQKDYNLHLKEVEAQHAAEKLMERTGIKMPALPRDVTSFGQYRDADSDESDMEGSDKEVVDEDPDGGGVVFTVTEH